MAKNGDEDTPLHGVAFNPVENVAFAKVCRLAVLWPLPPSHLPSLHLRSRTWRSPRCCLAVATVIPTMTAPTVPPTVTSAVTPQLLVEAGADRYICRYTFRYIYRYICRYICRYVQSRDIFRIPSAPAHGCRSR